MTKRVATTQERLWKLIRRFADAQESNSWKGGGDPEYIPEIERELKESKAKLREELLSLQHRIISVYQHAQNINYLISTLPLDSANDETKRVIDGIRIAAECIEEATTH